MGGRANALIGALFFFGGIIVTIVTYTAAEGGGTYVVAWGAIIFGAIQMFRGLSIPDKPYDEMEYEPAPVAAQRAPDGVTPARMIEGHISYDDYPARALRDGIEGTVVVGFLVDEAGAVGEVHVKSSSGDESLDQAAVDAVERRFRFEPARDANGEAVSQARSQSIRWQIA